MAISAYCGRPGAGKSYGVVQNVVVPCLEQGRMIVTNLPLRMDLVYERFPDAEVILFDFQEVRAGLLDLEQRADLRGAVFIIDEAWKFWPNGQRVTDLPPHHRQFFAEHRHFVGAKGLTTEIVLVCQSLNQITSAVRELVDATYIASKLDKVGQAGRYRVDIYSGPQALTRPDQNQLVRRGFGRYEEATWSLYQSHTHNETDFAAGLEQPSDKRTSIWSSPYFRLVLPVAVVGGCFAVWGLLSFLNPSRYRADDQDPGVAAAGPAGPPPVSAFPAVSVARPVRVADQADLSETWRIGAIIEGEEGGRGWALLLDRDGIQRTVPIVGHCSTVRGTRWEWECVVDGELVTYYSGREGGRTLL
jgi:zona occludens toxin